MAGLTVAALGAQIDALIRQRDEVIARVKQLEKFLATNHGDLGAAVIGLMQRAERAEQERDAMQRRAESAEADLHDAEHALDLIHAADQRAIQLWRAAHSDNDLVMPDSAKLSVWLMEQLDQARAENERLLNDINRYGAHNLDCALLICEGVCSCGLEEALNATRT